MMYTYHIKLLKPRTKIATPVNLTTAAKSASNASMRLGNIGANASGPKPCMKVTLVDAVMQRPFHNGLQF